MNSWDAFLDQRRDASLDELRALLRIPSISSLTGHAADVERAAEWVANRLRTAGLEGVEIMPTGGHPVVYAEWLHAAGKPVVLIYGHFDVQPVDPLELWDDPPFEAVVRDGRVYARGASDMKGNLMIAVLAVEAILRTDGALPINVKFLLEGQEEIGSPQLPAFVAKHRELLACDLAVSADGGQWQEGQPSLSVGLRGGCGLQIDVHGPKADLHSGSFGGAVHNPIHALVGILSSLRGQDHRVLVEGFYDRVRPLTESERREIAAVPFDEETCRAELGVEALAGEAGHTTLERTWTRPTLEVNGIWGGFQGEGVKTVLPASAHAKITCRLVPDQQPEAILEQLDRHIRKNSPVGVTVEVTSLSFLARPYLIPVDHPGNRLAASALKDVYGKPVAYVRSGGSVPACETILTHLGAYTVTLGFGLSDERIHSPNEFWRLDSFARGQRVWVRLLDNLKDYPLS